VPVDVLFGFVVNSIGDEADADIADGFCDVDQAVPGEQCTLRAAIQQANATQGDDLILFDISGTGTQTISPQSPLPEVTDPVTIDATSQPGFAGSPLIELNGTDAGADTDGLRITAGNSTVRGLAINRFTGNGLRLSNGGGNTIEGNYIGTDVTGTLPLPNQKDGVLIDGASDNTIGGIDAGILDSGCVGIGGS